MADEVDISTERMEKEQESRRKVQKYLAGVRELQPIGACHCCSEPFGPGDNRLFCDELCSGDWETEKRLKRMAGR